MNCSIKKEKKKGIGKCMMHLTSQNLNSIELSLNADFAIVFCDCFLFILKYAVDNIEQEIKLNLEVQYNLIQFVILI